MRSDDMHTIDMCSINKHLVDMHFVHFCSKDIGLLGRQAEFVTPTKQVVSSIRGNHTSIVSLQCLEGGVRCV